MKIELSSSTDRRTNPTKFLNNLLNEFAKTSEQLYRRWEEYPFIHSEQQLNALLFPAFIKMKCAVFPELPFKKNDGDQRFLDYYVEHEKSVYLIELKHARQCVTSGIQTTQRADAEWCTAVSQIDDITKRIADRLIDREMGYDVYKVALIVMPIHSSNNEYEQISQKYANDLHGEFDRFRGQKNSADFVGVWKIGNYKDKPHREGTEYYPYLTFVAKVKKLA